MKATHGCSELGNDRHKQARDQKAARGGKWGRGRALIPVHLPGALPPQSAVGSTLMTRDNRKRQNRQLFSWMKDKSDRMSAHWGAGSIKVLQEKTSEQENDKQIKAIKCNLKCLREMKPSPTTCYFSIGVLLQMCVQHRVADLVTNLVCRQKQ